MLNACILSPRILIRVGMLNFYITKVFFTWNIVFGFVSECKHQDDTYYEFLVESEHTDIEEASDLEGWNESEDVLECKRESGDNDFCVFHEELNVENREEVRNELISELKIDKEEPLLLSEATLCRLIIEDITVSRPVWIIGSTFENRFELNDIEFEDVSIFDNCEFKDITSFTGTKFHEYASFEDVEYFSESEFESVEFGNGVNFNDSTFDESTVFDRMKVRGHCSFKYTSFIEETQFASCRFMDETNFYGAEFESQAKISKARDIEQVDAQVNSKTRFDKEANFGEVKFQQSARINVRFKDHVDLRGSNLEGCDLSNIELSGANLENANLSNTILYDADLRGCRLMGCDLSDARLNRNSKFLGNPQSQAVKGYDHSISSILENKRCYYDPNADYRDGDNEESDNELRNKARTVYRELQELGKSTSHSQLQTRCFVRRKDMERDRYWQDIWSLRSGYTQPIVSAARWLRAKFSRIVMLYGESPWRVLIWSLITIIGFALSYIMFGLIENSNGVVQVSISTLLDNPGEFFGTLVGSVYYSALIFTNLSFGRYSPVGAGTYATAIETTIGLTMLALFFFVLGRRASK